jgi:hypothetical protein
VRTTWNTQVPFSNVVAGEQRAALARAAPTGILAVYAAGVAAEAPDRETPL